MSEFKRNDGESFKDYLIRFGNQHKDYGWTKLTNVFNNLSGLNYTSDSWRKWYHKEVVGDEYNHSPLPISIDFSHDDITDLKEERILSLEKELKETKERMNAEADAIKKERMKLSEERKEYNRWLREEARDELITERICDEIKNCVRIDFPATALKTDSYSTRDYVLAISDAHYGCEFEILGLSGEVLNRYSPEVFEYRMQRLLEKTIEYIKKENISELNVYDLGDSTDGMLRVGQIWKLRYGVVESAVRYANFMANWLNELSEHVVVKFQITNGNHTELRQLGQPKGTFTKDNMGIVIKEFIKCALMNNPNFTFIDNPTGYIYSELHTNTILGIHGEVKNMKNAIKDFSKIYKKDIDYLIAGHLHHSELSDVGMNSEVINTPSIIGVDDYSMSIMRTANAAAKILTFDKKDGLINDYRIKLN